MPGGVAGSIEMLCTVIAGWLGASRTAGPSMLCKVPALASRTISSEKSAPSCARAAASSTTKPDVGTLESKTRRPERTAAGLHPSLERAIDDDVVVAERGHERRLDIRGAAARIAPNRCDRQLRAPRAARRAPAAASGGAFERARRRGAAGGEEQRERRGVQSFAQFPDPLLARLTVCTVCTVEALNAKSSDALFRRWRRSFTGSSPP